MSGEQEAECSRHAVKRIRQRLGLNKSAAVREMERALDGLSQSDFRGSFRRYLDYRSRAHHSRFKITPAGIFAFSKSMVLITVYPVPAKYRAVVQAEWGKRKVSLETSEERPADQEPPRRETQ